MAAKMNRRMFGGGLLSGAALALATKSTAAQTRKPDTLQDLRWQEVAPGTWVASIGIAEAITPVKVRSIHPDLDGMKLLPTVTTPVLELPKASISRRGVSLSLPLAAHEEIFGFGLQFHNTKHRGRKLVTRVNADPTGNTGDSHAPVPFFISSRGYGLLVDTARYTTFYCGDVKPKPEKQLPTQEDGDITPPYSNNLAEEDNSRILVDVPVAQGVDIYLFAGPGMIDAVRRYNLFSGGGVLPPEWGLGFWYRAASRAQQEQILKLATEFRERAIPCDVIGLEPGWQSHAYSCSYVWNRKRFPEPDSLLRALRQSNFHVNLWEHAFVHPSSPLFAPLSERSGDYAVWEGLVPDFLDAEACSRFGEDHGRRLIDAGVSGFKLDECDNSDFTGGWSYAESTTFPSGADGEQMHSLFGIRYQQTIFEPFQKRGLKTYSLVRSSGALAAPYPFVLYSDLYDHRQFVRALVNAGFSGLLWCPEVRDAKSEEDLIRRLQTVMFSPLAMINGWYIINPPWKQIDRKKNNANIFSENWEQLEMRCQEIIGWRMQLVPYLRAAFARYRADGTPPFRALILDWPEHAELAKIDDAWMVGDRLLIAPLFAGEPQGRLLTLPPGQWFDFWTGKPQAGGATIQVPATTRNIPAFVKAGSVFPMAQITTSTASPAAHTLKVRIFGDGSLPFTLRTQEGELKLIWDARSNSGKIYQKGTEKYFVTSWEA